MDATYLDLTIRLSMALALGGAIGIEREYRAKEAGFRTHFLVALGSALFCIVSQYGYMACAWAGFAGYATAMTLSYIVGQKYYPIKYDLGRIGVYVILALITFGLIKFNEYIWDNIVIRIIGNTVLLILFVSYIVKKDFPISPILKKLGIKN